MEREAAGLVDDVVTAVARSRLNAAKKKDTIRNQHAWLSRVVANIRSDPSYMAELERVCGKWPGAPVDMLANAAEGDVSMHLSHYETRAS